MNINWNEFACDYITAVQDMVNSINLKEVKKATDLIKSCKGIVWLIGNGGSAALASHMATDLQLAGVRAISLTDVAAITTYANDFDFVSCFKKQLVSLTREGDLIIAISGSGKSLNICEAIQRMYCPISGFGIPVIGITGFDGGHMKDICTVHINVPAQHIGVSQDGHQIVLHIIAYYLMNELKKTPPVQ